MVLVMESDGSLIPSRSQNSFARNYNDGIGQGSASDGIAIFGEVEAEKEGVQVAAFARPTPLPRADVLSGIQTTALRYAGHPGLRRAGLSVTDWLALYRANIEVESAYRQDAISSAGAIGLGQLMPATARDLGVDPRDPLQNLDGSARYLAMMLERFGDPRLALAAYNAGPDAVRQHGGIPPSGALLRTLAGCGTRSPMATVRGAKLVVMGYPSRWVRCGPRTHARDQSPASGITTTKGPLTL